MTLYSVIETLLIGPLKLVFEIIFDIANRFIGHPGLAIIALSLVMNTLLLPLYRQADLVQEKARDTEAKLKDGINHIKSVFSGDERMMILQTYYRQNNYSPLSALSGSISLLLEIPFFMAAYQCMTHLSELDGVSFGPIANLGAPDGMIVIGGIAINFLPILMTVVNIVSSTIYLKGFPLKTKIQLYAMAMFFLVFLYESPACLVFYWTLNNVFSLVKNILCKLKNPKKVMSIAVSVAGLALLGYGCFGIAAAMVRRKIFLMAMGIGLQLPLLISKFNIKLSKGINSAAPNKKLFITGAVFLSLLTGALIPSNFIAASPQEYVDIYAFYNPLWYVLSTVAFAAGTFLVWFGVFYWLANDSGKVLFEKLAWVLSGIMVINYMFFGTDLGILFPSLVYENGVNFSLAEQLINLVVVAFAAAVMLYVFKRWSKAAAMVLLTGAIAIGAMSAVNVFTIKNSVDKITSYSAEGSNSPSFRLSTTGKNVIVLMLDRAVGEYVPYLFNEKPELAEQFSGFTYYTNVISFASTTNGGSPALFGGYEYTPVEMNKRSDEKLVDKHNEAIKMMPVLFSENGYEVTVCDPVYANYQWIPDVSIFDEYEGIDAFVTDGRFSGQDDILALVPVKQRNFFCFSIMKTMPLAAQYTIYNNGEYNQALTYGEGEVKSSVQVVTDMSRASGITQAFTNAYNVLLNLPTMTRITEDNINTYMSLVNNVTHEPMILQEPEYVPAMEVDNAAFDEKNADRFILDGRSLVVNTAWRMQHYQSNMAAFLQLGEWFDYLKENNVYDNTRIIIVADHGADFGHLEELLYTLDDYTFTAESYFPLLMVKDFGAEGFTSSDEFMTNADVPTLATEGVIENAINPFTGKAINNDEKTAHDQYIMTSRDWEVENNNGNVFNASEWLSVKENIWDVANWTHVDETIVLADNIAP